MLLELATLAVFFKSTDCLSNVTAKQYGLMPELFLFDNYKHCMCSDNDDNPIYCRVNVELFPENPSNTSLVWDIIEEVSSNKWNYRHNILRHGICASRICTTSKNLSKCLDLHYKKNFINLELVGQVIHRHCDTKDPEYILTNLDLILMAFLGAYVVFILGVSLWLEIGNKNNLKSKKLFLSFSIRDNFRYIFSTTSKPTQSYMLYIQGMRFVISVIIIAVHSGAIAAIPVKNPSLIEEQAPKFSTIFLARLTSIVQGFFVISAWLLAINFYEKLKKVDEVKLNLVVRIIIRRYIRLTPGKAVLLILHSTYLVHLVRGPFWPSLMSVKYQTCRQKWWLHLSYLSNMFVADIRCLPHTWSMTVDFQLTVLGILILWLTQKKPRLLFLLLGLVVSFQVIFMVFYLGGKNFEFGILGTPENAYNFTFLTREDYQATWTTTYSNLSGLVSGLCFGYLYVNSKMKKFMTIKKYKTLWSILTFSSTFGVVLFSTYYMTTEYYSSSRWFAACYGGINKPLFVFGIGFFIFGLSQGLGGVVKKSLEWSFMHTLGQLSFGAYLIHLTIAKTILGSNMELVQRSKGLAIYEASRLVILAYFGSLVYTVLFLLPVERLSKSFLK